MTQINQTDTMVLLSEPISETKELRDHTEVHLTQKVEEMDRGRPDINLQYKLILEGNESLVAPFRKFF